MTLSDVDQLIDLLFKHLVMVVPWPVPQSRLLLKSLLQKVKNEVNIYPHPTRNQTRSTYLTPPQKRMHPQNIRVRILLLKICVLHPISSISQTQPRGVRTKLLNRLLQRQGITSTLAHLLSIQHQMPIRTHAEGELVLGEDRSMVIERECQVIWDEIFSGGTDVEWIEVVEFVFQSVGFFFWEWGWVGEGTITENVFPDLVCHLIWGDS